jgi:hypothetical protein
MTAPALWRQTLYRAALRGSDEEIVQLTQTLNPEQATLASNLSVWAQNFDFKPILDLLEDESLEGADNF